MKSSRMLLLCIAATTRTLLPSSLVAQERDTSGVEIQGGLTSAVGQYSKAVSFGFSGGLYWKQPVSNAWTLRMGVDAASHFLKDADGSVAHVGLTLSGISRVGTRFAIFGIGPYVSASNGTRSGTLLGSTFGLGQRLPQGSVEVKLVAINGGGGSVKYVVLSLGN